MSGRSNQQLVRMLQGRIVERQRLVGLPPVRAEKETGDEATLGDAVGGENGSGRRVTT